MTVLECIEAYSKKNRFYSYQVKKQGIEVFKRYILENELGRGIRTFTKEQLEDMVLVWLPKNKRYLSDEESYQLIKTINEIYSQINQTEETSAVLEMYANEYRRIYKVKNMLLSLTIDPVIGVDPIIVDLNKYRQQKKEEPAHSEFTINYEQALFEVEECKEDGVVILNKVGYNKTYKMLLEYPIYKYMKKGDILQASLKRRLFSIYWEFEEVKAYYLPQAKEYIQ